MNALLNEPSYSATGLDDEVVDETITEVKTFLRDSADEDSYVPFDREVQ